MQRRIKPRHYPFMRTTNKNVQARSLVMRELALLRSLGTRLRGIKRRLPGGPPRDVVLPRAEQASLAGRLPERPRSAGERP
jgi:hypothetical protein